MEDGPRVVWVTRHGERQDVVDPEWYRKPQRAYDDPPLAEKGRKQAFELAARLQHEHIDHIISSPFIRCVETAHIVSAARENALPIKIEPGICEIVWTYPPGYLNPLELKRSFPLIDEGYEAVNVPKCIEKISEDVYDRVVQTLRLLKEKKPGIFGQNVLYVGHVTSSASIIKYFTYRWHPVGLCTLTKLSPGDCGVYFTDLLCDSDHLSDVSDLKAVCDC